jgi:proteasome lid subunit RPN8/RPN11
VHEEPCRNQLEFELKITPQPMSLPAVFVVPPSIREAIMLHLLEAAPNEGVGLIATIAYDDGAVVEAVEFFPGTNLAASPTRFSMDVREVYAALREIKQSGCHMGAIVHSHLHGQATPSEIDLAEAHYPDALMVIVSFARQPAEMRAWHIARTEEQTVVSNVRIATSK